MSKSKTEIIKVQGATKQSKWQPLVGDETNKLINNLNIPENGKGEILKESVRILGKGINPEKVDIKTGLAIGYIQSGKTMSFTTVATLANDNNFPLIIVIGGTSTSLFNQSVQRLRNDLKIGTDRNWQFFENPRSSTSGGVSAIKDTLLEWEDPNTKLIGRQSVLIAVMKHHKWLQNLIDILNSFMLDWTKYPVLIIDDEADQASLNTKVNDDEISTTHRRVSELRSIFPKHNYIEYTATPQAQLLINLLNVLSPDYAEILTPGKDYVGGKTFFIDKPDLVKIILPNELKVIEDDTPPRSLLRAMSIFFIGVAAGHIVNNTTHRSMMVHPSIRTIKHHQFYVWVKAIRENWIKILSLKESDPDRVELINDFNISYKDLQKTCNDLPSFEDILSLLRTSIRKTVLHEINAARGGTPKIEWSNSYSHILVGGQAMDRGFTVEGLTVTYMPRSIGVGNADTIQQRARFFGYKKNYLGYCRIFIDKEAHDAYKRYVEHEEDIRKQLTDFSKTDKDLNEWKRLFIMPKGLKPTRSSVIDKEYLQYSFGDKWLSIDSPHVNLKHIVSNKVLIQNYIKSIKLKQLEQEQSLTPIMKHSVSESLTNIDVYSNLLAYFNVSDPRDSLRYAGMMLQIKNYLEKSIENKNENAIIYLMSYNLNTKSWLSRERSINDKDKISELFQGANPRGVNNSYPGDRSFKKEDRLSIQIYKLKLNSDQEIFDEVYTMGIWIPRKMEKGWIVQEQNA